MRNTMLTIVCAVCLLSTTSLRARPASSKPDAKAAFASLKTLAGSWKCEEPAGSTDFRVSGNGSVVVETMLPGTPHEMVNMYHLDGDNLLVTHYCASGNQPRMKLVSSENGTMKFEFLDATNLPSKNMPYMGELTLSISSADNVEEKWGSFAGGKPTEKITITMVRAAK